MKFNDIAKMLVLGLVLVLSACNSGGGNPDPDPDPNTLNLSGIYNGTFLFYNTSLIGNTSFTVAADGKVLGTISNDGAQLGTLSGTITGSSATSLDMDISITSTGSETYSCKGKGIYSESFKALQLTNGTGKDANDTYVGACSFATNKE